MSSYSRGLTYQIQLRARGGGLVERRLQLTATDYDISGDLSSEEVHAMMGGLSRLYSRSVTADIDNIDSEIKSVTVTVDGEVQTEPRRCSQCGQVVKA